jgi:uncharacterized membrane protein/uncharacterized protein YegL
MLTFDTLWPLGFLVLLVFIWWVDRNTQTDLSAGHRRIATGLRMALVAVLALAMTRPLLSFSGQWVSVVYLLDVSQSIAPDSLAAAIDWIEETDDAGGAEHSRFIPFAATSQVFDDVDGLRSVRVSDGPGEGAIDQTITDIESALGDAAANLAPFHLPKVVLVTDGNENRGSAKRAIARLAREGVEVLTRPVSERRGPDAWVDDVRSPARVTADELFPLDVHVFSQSAATGEVEVRIGDDVLETREVELVGGLNRIAFELRISENGPLNLATEVRVAGDPFPSNNTLLEAIATRGRPRVLYIEGAPGTSVYLEGSLSTGGIDVETRDPSGIPETAEEFDGFEAVILSDVRADVISPGQMEAISAYVRDLGGGFILAGGDAVFGEDGYSETEIEEILPVSFELEREPPEVALIIVLDKSGSMGGSKLELAKEASKAAVEVLQDDHMIGLVAFDYNHYWPVELQAAEQRVAINEDISTIVAGGETNIYPALKEAHEQLLAIDSEIKHVILLSDGRSLPDDFETLVLEMADAEETVSTVAVGNGADRELLNDIARWGTGRDYFIEDASRVPAIFTEETELATQGTLREQPVRVVVVKNVEAFTGVDFDTSPSLLGYVSTLAKDTAEVLLESDEDEGKPILARWQYGLGKTVAFTSDVKNRWSAEWLEWDGYGQLWPQLVRETMRRSDDGTVEMTVEKIDDEARIEVRGVDPSGAFINDLSAEVRVLTPSGQTADLALHQSAPGFYRAVYPLAERGTYVFRLSGDDAGISRTLPFSFPDEHRLYPPDVELLENLANATGGRFDPPVERIFETGQNTVVRPVELWPYLAGLALLLYLVDLLLRRVRLYESV